MIELFKGIKNGDLVVVPFLWPAEIAVGRATGKELWNDQAPKDCFNQHKVEFPKGPDGRVLKIPKANLSERLQRRIKQRRSVADLKDYHDEIEAAYSALAGGEEYDYKKRVGQKCSSLESEAKDRLLKNIRWGHTGLRTGGEGMELLVCELLQLSGYDNVDKLAKNTFRSSHADADIEASKDEKWYLFQVKHHDGETSNWGITQLAEIAKSHKATRYANHKPVLVTSGIVPAETYGSAEQSGIRVIDGKELIDWIWNFIPVLKPQTKLSLGISTAPQVIGHQLFTL